jgi:hypothetical protein
MDDTVTHNEGRAVKRLLHSKDNKHPDGGKDFHMKGGSSIDRCALAFMMAFLSARRVRLRAFDPVARAQSVCNMFTSRCGGIQELATDMASR